MKVVLDSSVWIEEFTQGPRWSKIRGTVPQRSVIFVPTIVIFEVFRKICKVTSKQMGLKAVANMIQHEVLELSQEIALSAANLSIENDLAMADSIVLASAKTKKATLFTTDLDFKGIPGVRIF